MFYNINFYLENVLKYYRWGYGTWTFLMNIFSIFVKLSLVIYYLLDPLHTYEWESIEDRTFLFCQLDQNVFPKLCRVSISISVQDGHYLYSRYMRSAPLDCLYWQQSSLNECESEDWRKTDNLWRSWAEC